jgi:hypothetical protein
MLLGPIRATTKDAVAFFLFSCAGLVEERPWLASAVHVPAAVRGPQPGAARRRPFIYM